MKSLLFASVAAILAASPAAAQMKIEPMGDLRPDQQQYFELYKELVETNTTQSAGSCTQAAQQIAARMKAAGFGDDQLTLFSVPEHPKDGGLVAVYPGTDAKAKPMLLLAHIDVVEAKREDWEREPFKLIEEDGYYYARGIADDKWMASVWADTLIRFKESGYKPKRTVKVALTCGEETDTAFNGANWLAQNKRDLIDAAFALNEGGGGDTDGNGNLVSQSIQVGEKIYQDYKLTATNPGGHSSVPVRKNAIYDMSAALLKIADHEFPMEFTDTTKAFFAKAGAARSDEMGEAMIALSNGSTDPEVLRQINSDRYFHSVLRTTCVATMIDGGHAVNALPQSVTANVNCRIFPGHDPVRIMGELIDIIGEDGITVSRARDDKPLAKAPPLDPKIIGPMEQLAEKYFPGVPVIPSMSTGATDGLYLAAVGIPVYGVPGAWGDPDGNGAHGLNERLEIKGVYTGRDYLFDLVKTLSSTK